MAEIKRNTTPVPNKMTVIDKGDEMSRPSSSGSSSRKPLKKATSEGLISLSPEPPSQVKFEEPPRPSPGSSRCESARRIEKKLQVLKKKVEPQLADFQNTSSSFETISKGKEPTVIVEALAKQPQNDSSKKSVFEEKPNNKQETNPEESTDDSSDSDSDDSDSDEEKPTAPIEMKGEFIKHVMDEDYQKAKELCQKILLLEPNNSVCIEFHGLILQKLEQEKQAEEESDDEDDDDDDDEDDEEEDDDDSGNSDDESDEESESDSDDDDYTPPPGLNLIMGGLPIKPQPN